MTVALAGASAALAVVGAWEGLHALPGGPAGRVRVLLEPLTGALGDGRPASVANRRRLGVLTAGCLLFAGYLLAGSIGAVLLAMLGPLVASAALRHAQGRWRAGVAEGGVPAARALADALAGGRTPIAAVLEVARMNALPGVAGRELQRVVRAVEVGDDMVDALGKLAARARDPAWDAIVAAIAMQRRTGGDLAGLLRHVAETETVRLRLEADARSLTTQARFTARLVALMPAAALAIAELAMPGGAERTLGDPIGLALCVLGIVVIVGSLLVIRRIVRLPA